MYIALYLFLRRFSIVFFFPRSARKKRACFFFGREKCVRAVARLTIHYRQWRAAVPRPNDSPIIKSGS